MPGPRRAGRFDLAEIVVAHRAQLESSCRLNRQQKRVLTDIANCRTAALGGHVDQCTACGYEHPAYNSCRNRHCPKCQALAQDRWITEQRARMLDVKHFHVVFTLPAELRPLAAFAPRSLYDAMLHSAGCTLLEFGVSRLSATIGATLVLHTWTRSLGLHPHVHAIVSAGGLSLDRARWNKARRAYLFPIKAMARVFRGKMIDALKRDYRAREFDRFNDFRDPEGFARLVRTIAKLSWHVYAKPSFDRGEHVLQYLGRYTHRVGLANSRLLAVDARAVTFRTKGVGTETLTPVELLRRFVQHVLPDRLHKIRHVGLHAASAKRALARQILGSPVPALLRQPWRDRLVELTGRDASVCPRCAAPIRSIAVTAATARAPPQVAA